MFDFSFLLGLAGFLFMAAGFAARNDHVLRLLNLAGLFVWIWHFSLLEAYPVAAMMSLAFFMLLARLMDKTLLVRILLCTTAALLPLSLFGWGLGYFGVEAPLSVMVTLLMNAGMVLLSGHALTTSVAGGLALNAVVSIIVGSWPAVLSNLVNLSALMIRTSRMSPPSSTKVVTPT